jgi:SHS2 domain-containing protein
MGALFYRHVSPTEIKAMTYSDMGYWYTWHEVMAKEELNGVSNA